MGKKILTRWVIARILFKHLVHYKCDYKCEDNFAHIECPIAYRRHTTNDKVLKKFYTSAKNQKAKKLHAPGKILLGQKHPQPKEEK